MLRRRHEFIVVGKSLYLPYWRMQKAGRHPRKKVGKYRGFDYYGHYKTREAAEHVGMRMMSDSKKLSSSR